MFRSHRYSQLVLRFSLAGVFLWFGIGKFLQTQYWVDAWMPERIQNLASGVGMSPVNMVILIGIFEVLVASSLLTGYFQRWFALAAVVFLLVVLFFNGLNEVMVRDIGLMGALLALVMWPQRRYH